MNGLRIQKNALSTSKQNHSDRYSDFYFFFSSIFEKTTEFHWLLDGGYGIVFDLPNEWFTNAWYDEKTDMHRSAKLDEFESHILIDRRDEKSSILTTPDFLKKYGKFILDDWWDIIGFCTPPRDIDNYLNELNKIQDPPEKALFLDKTADICFFNVDAAYWEIFAKDESILKRIKKVMTNSSNKYNVTPINLTEKKV